MNWKLLFFLVLCPTLLFAQDTTPFKGSGNDGHASALQQAFDPYASITKFSPFLGSNSDGFDSDTFYQFDPLAYITKFGPFAGSTRDGYSKNMEIFAYTNQQLNCYGQQITYTVDASGGVAPYVGIGTFNYSAGTYTLMATDAQGYTATTVLSITQPSELQAGISYLPINCFGQTTTATIGAVGGTPGYSGVYTFTTYATTDTFVVSDSKGCADTLIHTITQPSQIQVTVSQVDTPVCAGDSIHLDVQATGGTLPYLGGSVGMKTVNWLGTYTVQVVDANTCTQTQAISLFQPPPLNPIIQHNLPVYAHDTLQLFTSIVADSFVWLAPNQVALSNSSFLTINNVNHALHAGIYTLHVVDSFGCHGSDSVNVHVRGVYAYSKAFLGGPFVAAQNKMHDSLRKNKVLPLLEPYGSGLGMQSALTHVNGGGGETTDTLVLNKTGDSAVVDWVFLQVRDSLDPAQVLATKSALIRRDGLIVDAHDGLSPVYFRELVPGNYVLTIKHRNHFGLQSLNALTLNDTMNFYNFSDSSIALYSAPAPNNTNLAYRLIGSTRVMWAGDINKDRRIRYNGVNNDRLSLLSLVGATNTLNGYLKSDINLDGKSRYNGVNNDRLPILQNSGSTIVSNEQTSN